MGNKGDAEPDIDLQFNWESGREVALNATKELLGMRHIVKAGTIGTLPEDLADYYTREYFTLIGHEVLESRIEEIVDRIKWVKYDFGTHPYGYMLFELVPDLKRITPLNFQWNMEQFSDLATHLEYHALDGRMAVKVDYEDSDYQQMFYLLWKYTGIHPNDADIEDKRLWEIFADSSKLAGIPRFLREEARQMVKTIKPSSFSELMRVCGLLSSTDAWEGNGELLFKKDGMELRDLICDRESVMDTLVEYGADEMIAFQIMERVRKGKGLKAEHREFMAGIGIPEWFIRSCEKVKYLGSRGNSIEAAKGTLRFVFYKVYYPAAFLAAYFSVMSKYIRSSVIEGGLSAFQEALKIAEQEGLEDKAESYRAAVELYEAGFSFAEADDADDRFFWLRGKQLILPRRWKEIEDRENEAFMEAGREITEKGGKTYGTDGEI